MIIAHRSVPAVAGRAVGPGGYLLSEVDCRGHRRPVQPSVVAGTAVRFDGYCSLSQSRHPHLHAILSYRDEANPPSRQDRNNIIRLYLATLKAGIADRFVEHLVVDHGDHDHVTVLRHFVERSWRRWQPYYHSKDWHLVGDLLRLVNRRYGFNSPEDPARAQLITPATRHFTDEQAEFIRSIREKIKVAGDAGWPETHDAFLNYLKDERGCKVRLRSGIPGQDADENPHHAGRVYLMITTPTKLVVLAKGPVCLPGFSLASQRQEQAKRQQAYDHFLQDPSPVWNRFQSGFACRVKRHRQLYRKFLQPADVEFGAVFAELNPSLQPGRPKLPDLPATPSAPFSL